jgi:hypothetical protein
LHFDHIHIQGDGVAARTCAHLLHRAGFRVSFEHTSRTPVPAILLGDAALRLLRDIFERDDLFRDAPRIHKRIVSWGDTSAELDHSAISVSEQTLLDGLGRIAQSEPANAAWTIRATGLSESHRFGSRLATAASVEMKSQQACWIESVDQGWLFLNSGWLLSVGEASLDQSKVIVNQIETIDASPSQFPASPRMTAHLNGPNWLCCGTAAMAFDPLCGDGTAHAVREAILASAVIRRIAQGDEPAPLLAHYEARLTAGFHRHLAECHNYYQSGGSSSWWRDQAEASARGMEWCRQKLESHGKFRYQLNGLELFRI